MLLKQKSGRNRSNKENIMESSTIEKDADGGLTDTAFTLAHLTAKAAEGKMLAEDLLEIGKRKARKAIRRSRETGEDYLDETTHYIKHHPWESVGVAAGVGAFVGLLFGWACSRALKRSEV
jgi:ElaB/YqjD/DUF883 family membrane-anchored ribosome-binding protein